MFFMRSGNKPASFFDKMICLIYYYSQTTSSFLQPKKGGLMDFDWILMGLYAIAFFCVVGMIIGLIVAVIGSCGMHSFFRQKALNGKLRRKRNLLIQERPA
jgi:hypothetical protein